MYKNLLNIFIYPNYFTITQHIMCIHVQVNRYIHTHFQKISNG